MGKQSIIVILSILPFAWMLAAIPFVNRIYPIIFGLPFLAFWLFLGMLVIPLLNYVIYRLQRLERGEE